MDFHLTITSLFSTRTSLGEYREIESRSYAYAGGKPRFGNSGGFYLQAEPILINQIIGIIKLL